MKKCPSAFSMPMSTAASATRVKSSVISRASTRSTRFFPGPARNRRRHTNKRFRESDAHNHEQAGHNHQRGHDLVGKLPGARFACNGELTLVNVGTNAALIAPSANGSQCQVGNAESNAKSIVRVPRAEVERQDLVADEPEDATGHRGQTEHSADRARCGAGSDIRGRVLANRNSTGKIRVIRPVRVIRVIRVFCVICVICVISGRQTGPDRAEGTRRMVRGTTGPFKGYRRSGTLKCLTGCQ